MPSDLLTMHFTLQTQPQVFYLDLVAALISFLARGKLVVLIYSETSSTITVTPPSRIGTWDK